MAAFGILNNDLTINKKIVFYDNIFFGLFSVSLILNFLKDYVPVGETQSSRDLKKIAVRYLKGQFAVDFIAWIPFQWLVDMEKEHLLNALFAIKVIRLKNIK